MFEALEVKLHIEEKEKEWSKILQVFELAKSVQLPVLRDRKVVGLLDLFFLLKKSGPDEEVDVSSLMEKDFSVAGDNKNVFSFKNSKQLILPFVDERGNYLGFVNKLFQKCYLPSKEYMQVVEKSLENVVLSDTEVDTIELVKHFDVIFESNYDGIYVTVEKGKTLSINNRSRYVSGIGVEDLLHDEAPIQGRQRPGGERVNVIQDIQKRNEISISDELIADGGIVRVIGNIKDLERIMGELNEAQSLAATYQKELEYLRWEHSKADQVVAKSPEMKKIINLALRVAKVDSTVLIQGQSGVGKGILSELIHDNSYRRDGPFLKIDCGSIPETLLESELFGYAPGAFTGAGKEGKIGLIELANRGTLFLDEIGDLPLKLQMKLLRVIQDKEIIRVGGKKALPLDIRIIAATNRDLTEMVKQKRFRSDLYYRLNVVPIMIPPLAERREDIPPLIEDCLQIFNKKYGLNMTMEPAALKKLIDYRWPGNVRELENVVEYLVVTTGDRTIKIDHIPENILKDQGMPAVEELPPGVEGSLKDALSLVEKKLLLDAMQRANNTGEMAEMLGIDRSTVTRKLQKHHLKTIFASS